MKQIALPLDTDFQAGHHSYIVTAVNQAAHDFMEGLEDRTGKVTILTGPPKSGKTSMAHKFQNEAGGDVVENANRMNDDELFHLWNLANETARPLLLVSEMPVAEWGVVLPDLRSRLAASVHLEIGLPDDAMIEGLIQSFFALRGRAVSPDALAYLIKRAERSYANILKLASDMEDLSLRNNSLVTISVARAALAAQSSGD